jgi:hypothetical protein
MHMNSCGRYGHFRSRRFAPAVLLSLALLLIWLIGSVSALPVEGEDALHPSAPADNPLRILFVGNSYTNGSWRAIQAVFKAEAPNVVLEKQTAGGAKLTAWAKNADLLKRIREGDWDYVVLQEQSQVPSLPDPHLKGFFDAATTLDKHIRDSGAKTVFFMTWGRRDGDKHNRQINPDFETMQRRLAASYREIALQRDALLAPVGEAYARIKQTDPDLFPRLYKGDGSHPALGAYVAAYCLHRAIRGKTPEIPTIPATARPGDLPDDETLRAIQDAVAAAFEP